MTEITAATVGAFALFSLATGSIGPAHAADGRVIATGKDARIVIACLINTFKNGQYPLLPWIDWEEVHIADPNKKPSVIADLGNFRQPLGAASRSAEGGTICRQQTVETYKKIISNPINDPENRFGKREYYWKSVFYIGIPTQINKKIVVEYTWTTATNRPLRIENGFKCDGPFHGGTIFSASFVKSKGNWIYLGPKETGGFDMGYPPCLHEEEDNATKQFPAPGGPSSPPPQ